jgi:hypothetical protein
VISEKRLKIRHACSNHSAHELALVQIIVETLPLHQFIVGSLFYDMSAFHNENAVSVSYR